MSVSTESISGAPPPAAGSAGLGAGLAQAFQQAAIGMALARPDGALLQANAALGQMLETPLDSLGGQPLLGFIHPDDRAPLRAEWQRLAQGGLQGGPMRVRLRLLHGEHRLVALHSAPFSSPPADGGAAGLASAPALPATLMLQLQDVTEHHAAEARLAHVALHDGLTSLANRVRFCACLAQAIARAQAEPESGFAVLVLDFDHFKRINDTLGHTAGDRFLTLVARRIAEVVRPVDIVGRMGGDEFAVLVEAVRDPAPVRALAQRLLQHLQQPYRLDGQEVEGSASIGLTFSLQGYDSPADVLRDADLAMYRAKRLGRGQVAEFEPGLRLQLAEQVSLERALRRALARDELVLAYQPIVDLATGQVHSLEALVRWMHPERGEVPPASFIPLAEESGLITLLTLRVLDLACRDLARMRSTQGGGTGEGGVHLHVNISGSDIERPGFVEDVTDALRRHGVPAHQLVLELTETTVMQRVELAQAAMQRLRALGLQLSIDDFGTGYSSLAYLSSLPIDSLKIDRAFIRHLSPGSRDAEVVRAVAALGQALGKQVIAEGIETPQQLAQLRQLGCRFGQGYLIGRPLEPEAAFALMQGRGPALQPAVPVLGEELILPGR